MPITREMIRSFFSAGALSAVDTPKTVELSAMFPAMDDGKTMKFNRAYGTLYAAYKHAVSDYPNNTICISQGYNNDNNIRVSISANWNNPNAYCRSRVVKPLETDETVWDVIKRAIQLIADIYQKPSSVGSVKAYYDATKEFWTWKRASSPHIIKVGDDYFFTKTDPRCVKVYISETETVLRILETRDISGPNCPYLALNGRYYARDVLVPVYKNMIPFDSVRMYVLPSQTRRYNFVMVDGQRRYIDLKKASSSLHDVPIHGYSTRIESLIPEEHLFQKGKVDLYAKRDKAETPFLGWELEALVESDHTQKAAEHVKLLMDNQLMCKNDSSIGSSGFEIVSVPATLDFWKESNLSSALDTMRLNPFKMRSFSSASCGFHVHVSRSALSVLDLQKMERFVHNPDNRDFMVKIANRPANTYQNYNDSLYTGRKSLSGVSQGEHLIDGLDFFNGVSDFEEYIDAVAVITQGQDDHKLITKWVRGVESYVGHDSLDRFFRTRCPDEHAEITELMGESYRFTAGNFAYAAKNRSYAPYVGLPSASSVTDAEWKERVLLVFKLYYVTIGKQHAVINRKLRKLFPHWDIEPFGGEEEKTDFSRFGGIRKSSLPSSRRNSYDASQRSPGPVGKAVTGRYDVLNTRNVNTVEFRLFKGTMNPTTVMRYLEFVDALVRFVAQTSASSSGLHYKAFTSWLISDGFNVSRYEHLISFCTANDLIDRKSIRRKDIPVVVSDDSNCIGLVAIQPVYKDVIETPLGTFNSNPEVEVPTTVGLTVPSYDPETDEFDEPDDYYEEECNYAEDADDCGDPDCGLCNR